MFLTIRDKASLSLECHLEHPSASSEMFSRLAIDFRAYVTVRFYLMGESYRSRLTGPTIEALQTNLLSALRLPGTNMRRSIRV